MILSRKHRWIFEKGQILALQNKNMAKNFRYFILNSIHSRVLDRTPNLASHNVDWKFHDFCIIQILREINFEDFRSAKSAILVHLEVMNFDFKDFCTF